MKPNPQGKLLVPAITDHQQIIFSLVIPTYQESKNVAEIIELLSSKLDITLPNSYELIIVDDDSPDRTWEVAESLLPEYPCLRVIRRQNERGLATAVIRGWQAAKGRILGVIDGDLQHPPEVLWQLYQSIEQGADLAVGSRHVDGGGVSDWSIIRRFLSRGAQILGLTILPEVIGRVSDPMSGYFLIRRSAIESRYLSPLGYKILIEVLGRGKIGNIAEIGYEFQERNEGESKVTWKQYVEYLGHLIRLRIDRSQRFLRFILVGLTGVFVDMAILYLLSDESTLNWGLTRSKIIAAEVAIINNFLWNDRWTFADISKGQTSKRQIFKRFVKFNLVCLAGLIINVLILNGIYNFILKNKYIANFISIAIVTIWNFWINLKLNWRVTEK